MINKEKRIKRLAESLTEVLKSEQDLSICEIALSNVRVAINILKQLENLQGKELQDAADKLSDHIKKFKTS